MSLKPRRVDFDGVWKQLLETVKGVITCGRVERAVWNDRFYDVYALCVAYPEPLGERLYTETKLFLEQHVKDLHGVIGESGEENLLSTYHKHWQEFSKGSSYLNQLYGYLNSQFIKKQKYSDADLNYGGFGIELAEQMLEIGELALDTWKRFMIEPLTKTLLSLLLDEIQSDRTGGNVTQGVIHGVIGSFVNVEEYKKKAPLKLYEDLFETPFLKKTGEYYRQEALKQLDVCNCSEYLKKVKQKLEEEDLRSRKFLPGTSYDKVTRECQQRMVADHLQFLHSECREMVQKEKREDLTNMYRLLIPIHNGLDVLVQEVEQHIRETGLQSVKQMKQDSPQTPATFVEAMLEVHLKYTELITAVFGGDKLFVGALDKACATTINFKVNPKTICKSPEHLARYCDSLLKKSTKGMNESEIDDKLQQSITVFKYLDDKDIFQRHYARMLAKRLIYSQSQSMDAEEAMINRLKQACGYEFTNKLHRMFTDMTISADLQSKFSDMIKKEKHDIGVNFSISVLQAGAWPIGQSNLPSFSIPQELEKSVRVFELFYNSQFNGRKLTWMHSFCNAELKINYLKKPYFVQMATFNMGILLPFNNNEKFSFHELATITNLPKNELTKQLRTLIDSKILKSAQSDEKAPLDDATFILNMAYTNKRTKFKIAAAAQKESPQEVEQAHNAVDEDRKLYLQAAIVRIMKARKILKHNLLIQEVISQSKARFAPSIHMIKKCIEALIEKQYIERTEKTSDEYSYVA